MIQVKEISNEVAVECSLNNWLKENKNTEIIDIKYSADLYSSNVLIIYKVEDK
ncbi:hypothetical protein [Clostridium felsineum]|uniref:Uncharacterized protein n=1 Tax=Clostridium felsineum TaxID=36839 RepID=A0A1S8L3D9_9CLOT|nr:hypothetical protein [Clostridium felsineum]MCR3760297.1 hypothetical protein [Clostridium felsineum]URZ07559.1 hypothetical protein CLROS_028980 [Clostridium felsineum]URZ12590.1 hypothetical protein CROST_033130 [Clostridium felsineum]